MPAATMPLLAGAAVVVVVLVVQKPCAVFIFSITQGITGVDVVIAAYLPLN